MLKTFTATIKDGALVLPEGADLGPSGEGDTVSVAVEVADAIDRPADQAETRKDPPPLRTAP